MATSTQEGGKTNVVLQHDFSHLRHPHFRDMARVVRHHPCPQAAGVASCPRRQSVTAANSESSAELCEDADRLELLLCRAISELLKVLVSAYVYHPAPGPEIVGNCAGTKYGLLH